MENLLTINNTNIKITQEQAQQILLEYLENNSESLDAMKYPGSTGKYDCKIQLYCYEYKLCWRFEFDIGGSFVVIDANNGDIIDTYFHNGIYIYT